MAEVIIRQLTKSFGDNTVVKSVSLKAEDGEFLVLLGPSGCGKSTILRLIAGLEDATSGEILIDGKIVNFVSPVNRNAAFVFQNYALYPHMTVFKNIAFPLATAGMPRPEIDAAVQEAARILELSHLLERLPSQLSGGQRQRVALARAIVRKPAVFLMDEPLSNLDAQLRQQTRLELMDLHQRLGITTIYVTHDQVEAMTMGQRIAILKDGDLQQVAPPLEAYDQPANTFVARFMGAPPMNLIPVTVSGSGSGWTASGQGGSVELDLKAMGVTQAAIGAHASEQLQFGVRPEHLSLAASGTGLSGKVRFVEPTGSDTFVTVQIGEENVVVRCAAHETAKVGASVGLEVDVAKAHLFSTDGWNLRTK